MAKVDESYIKEMLDHLEPVGKVLGCNGPAFYMFCVAAEKMGKAIEDLTLGEIAELEQRVGERYNSLFN